MVQCARNPIFRQMSAPISINSRSRANLSPGSQGAALPPFLKEEQPGLHLIACPFPNNTISNLFHRSPQFLKETIYSSSTTSDRHEALTPTQDGSRCCLETVGALVSSGGSGGLDSQEMLSVPRQIHACIGSNLSIMSPLMKDKLSSKLLQPRSRAAVWQVFSRLI